MEPLEEYVCIMDLAWTAWTGNPAVRCEVRGSACLKTITCMTSR
ncbi:O-glucosyltransferase rumi [Gossypium arboreum]|uniref:O-glucosyltransferase rumi n=1 Tax=Gossypium arboreum TaxID=29729 RepID=A0A0B0PCQ2_GOSAR|nr:O-glucosyltransferase rumi [Gossypium arboreum]KHG29926.1 O-glucosyltransferase rumi [Gossypium arboreum]